MSTTSFKMRLSNVGAIITLLLVLPVPTGSMGDSSRKKSTILTSVINEEASQQMCRDRGTFSDVEHFQKRSCAMCYQYLFPKGKFLSVKQPEMEHLYSPVPVNTTSTFPDQIPADISNETAKFLICSTLTSDECDRWTECCQSAHDCCARQLSMPARISDVSSRDYCERTWDGYSCWDDADSGSEIKTQCPSFMMEFSMARGKAIKHCTANGTWFMQQHGRHSYEWTDYRPCLDKDAYLIDVYIILGFNIASLLALIPAIAIFFIFRDLYRQHRIRLHLNFFISLALNSMASIQWYMLVHRDLFTNEDNMATVMYKNPVWCRILSFLKIYLTSSNYFWMFCEGYYLHRLISKAFEPPKTLIGLYLLGWAVPATSAIVYCVIRAVHANESCWARSLGGIEWLYYGPNLLCLVVNLFFLCNILRILLFQLHSHPHEPSNFRRGLKAAFMLIPLFGLQFFLTLYRLKPGTPGEREFEYLTFSLTSSQGIFVALIFCFFNGEVLSQMRRVCPCWLGPRYRHRPMVTQLTTAEDRRSRSPTLSYRSRNSMGSPENSHGLLANNGVEVEMCEMTKLKTNGSVNNLKRNESRERTDIEYTMIPTVTVSDSKS